LSNYLLVQLIYAYVFNVYFTYFKKGKYREDRNKAEIFAFVEPNFWDGVAINMKYLLGNITDRSKPGYYVVKLILLLLHEMAHIRRFVFGSKNDYLKISPYLDNLKTECESNLSMKKINENLIDVTNKEKEKNHTKGEIGEAFENLIGDVNLDLKIISLINNQFVIIEVKLKNL